jgi:hypothetical protein
MIRNRHIIGTLFIITFLCITILIFNRTEIRNEWTDLRDNEIVDLSRIFNFDWDYVTILMQPKGWYDFSEIEKFDRELLYKDFNDRTSFLLFYINDHIVQIYPFLADRTHPAFKNPKDLLSADWEINLKRDEAVFLCRRNEVNFELILDSVDNRYIL